MSSLRRLRVSRPVTVAAEFVRRDGGQRMLRWVLAVPSDAFRQRIRSHMRLLRGGLAVSVVLGRVPLRVACDGTSASPSRAPGATGLRSGRRAVGGRRRGRGERSGVGSQRVLDDAATHQRRPRVQWRLKFGRDIVGPFEVLSVEASSEVVDRAGGYRSRERRCLTRETRVSESSGRGRRLDGRAKEDTRQLRHVPSHAAAEFA